MEPRRQAGVVGRKGERDEVVEILVTASVTVSIVSRALRK